ncbi:MAG: 50S ribosomal protein L10 [Proteobacteria bacterium]|nr:50S ribosomal protein L10 [Cystobacterineae bacterium]MCL2258413.1 50S ribosomal protein L10 [Cystobacterineae bacterium]MCL2315334.1 50S ribosomal protein L10 [Pseudomonadota bacterium]
MLKSEKEAMVQELAAKFSKAKSVVVAEFNKIDVATATQLRCKLREGGIEYKVIKNTLAKRAAQGTPVGVVADDFAGPIALAISYGDVVAPAKILMEFLKDRDFLKVKSGVVDGQRLNAADITALSKLPGLPELRASLLGLLMQPAGKLVRTLAEPSSCLVRVLAQRLEKNS